MNTRTRTPGPGYPDVWVMGVMGVTGFADHGNETGIVHERMHRSLL
jgi:hypothetical protein